MPIIDKLIHSIEEVSTGRSFDTEICKLEKTDLKYVTKSKGWNFNWRVESNASGKKVYKLVIKEDSAIQGLISIQDMEDHLFLPLIEAAPHNFGKQKKYYGVAPNLTAFACKRSFELGYEGNVAFIAKTKLIKHYEETLGAILIGNQRMIIAGENAHKLVSLYFKDFLL